MGSDQLNERLQLYADKLILRHGRTNRLPATTIGAESAGLLKVAANGPVPRNIAPKLNTALLALGVPLGARRGKNRVGRCAEVRSSNLILSKINTLNISDIDFTPALRPRTGAVILRCNNCSDVFN